MLYGCVYGEFKWTNSLPFISYLTGMDPRLGFGRGFAGRLLCPCDPFSESPDEHGPRSKETIRIDDHRMRFFSRKSRRCSQHQLTSSVNRGMKWGMALGLLKLTRLWRKGPQSRHLALSGYFVSSVGTEEVDAESLTISIPGG